VVDRDDPPGAAGRLDPGRGGPLRCAIADEPRTGLQRAEAAGAIFRILWPIATAVVGLVLVVMFVVVPSLRDPALIAALSGLFTVVGAVGLSRRESR
jgi:hypothetical protein